MITLARQHLAPTLTAKQAASRAWDAVVIGAGPAGAVAALMLARQGVRVLLVEKASHPRYKVCGGCVGAAALRLIEQLDIANVITDLAGQAITELRLHAGRQAYSISLPTGLSVSRESFDAALVRAAIGAGTHYIDQTSARVEATSSQQAHVRLRTAHSCETLSTKLVLAADGLAGTSLAGETQLATSVRAASRIGVGTIVESDALAETSLVERGSIGMHYAPGGYVGLVRVERDRLNLAAAFDPAYVRESGGPAEAVARHLDASGMACPVALREALYTGTPALTRRRQRLASTRVLVIGDATGYVEPFTGEGMTWAMLSAVLAVPLAMEAIEQWRPELARQWQAKHASSIGKKQRACRLVSAISRHDFVCRNVIKLLSLQPALGRAAVRYVSGVERVAKLAAAPQAAAVVR
jgi:flavin-dependent dehydrogenase